MLGADAQCMKRPASSSAFIHYGVMHNPAHGGIKGDGRMAQSASFFFLPGRGMADARRAVFVAEAVLRASWIAMEPGATSAKGQKA